MMTSTDTNRLPYQTGWILFGLLLLLLILEGWRYAVKPSPATNEQIIEKNLSEAADYFVDKQRELRDQSRDLAATLRVPLLQKRPRSEFYEVLDQFPDFWSVSLFHQQQPLIWKGYALHDEVEQSKIQKADGVTLHRYNNIIYWQSHIPFSVQDTVGTISFNLYTTYRVEQSNVLPIGERNEYNLFDSPGWSSDYPLDFSLFSDPPEDIILARQLNNLAGDSVGVVYATSEEFQQTRENWAQNTRFWRSIYALLCFILLVFLLFQVTDRMSMWKGLTFQLSFIGISWGIFTYTGMPAYWILALSESGVDEWVQVVENLSTTGTHAFFGLLASLSISRNLNQIDRSIEANQYLSTLGLATIFGILNAVSLSWVFNAIQNATTAVEVPILDFRILPAWSTIYLYLILGISLLALGIFLMALNQLLFRSTREHYKLSASILAASFILALGSVQLFMPAQTVFSWIFICSALSFSIILAVSVSYFRDAILVTSLSPFRKIVLGSFIISVVGVPIIYQASFSNMDEELMEVARDYSREEDPFAAGLTEQLLTNLEEEFRSITAEDLTENQSMLQARFTQTVESFLSPQWSAYSFDLQLIDASGDLIADYATDLNSPNWLNIYNISTMQKVTEIEQITKSTIQPVVQLPQLVDQQRYRTFYRGWIPIFGSSNGNPIAWILSSIYQERPEFDKAIRAVMASLTYEDWNKAYLMQQYEQGELLTSAQQGFAGYFPKYQRLSQEKLQTLEQDSLIYETVYNDDYSYRILYWNYTPDQVIKVTTTLADYRLILFSFFRFNFVLLMAGFLVAGLGQLFSWGGIQFLGKNKRFQDRILDSFLLATLVFLGFLIATSHFAIKQQNRDIVRQELFDNLESLSESFENNESINNGQDIGSTLTLSAMTAPLDIDATVYQNQQVVATTTPQIYQQHLLPSSLPYEIYDKLYVQEQRDAYSTLNLAGQSLLIGYRTLLNEDNQPWATVAIPTFLESPKYDQQLLETTSYLILIYLLIFGFFILGSTLISQKLTRPLVYFQRGLNKISAGNLDTTIPVTSEDELGGLAKAYNNMVFRLKKLQGELAAAEREAAWKEMAQQVAHEIKNPLTPMKLNVQHLERQLKTDKYDTEELKKRVQKITSNLIDQIQSLSNIASDFSKFSQPLEEDFSQVDLVSILSSVSELYKHDENVQVSFESQSRLITIQGIADELKRVIINLVKNAYEALPEEGGEIVLRLYTKQGHAFIEVEDNGIGIPEEDRGNIFVPNFSTKSSGTGLGLAICKKIVEAHDGSITFASVEEEGTTFVIKLPMTQAET